MKILIALLYTLSLALPQMAFSQTPPPAASTFVKPPPQPEYETCKMIDQTTGDNSYQVPDYACQSRNQEKTRNYNAAMEAYNRSLRIVSTDATTTTRPADPVYENCQTTNNGDGGNYHDYACESRNAAKRHDHSIQIQAWNKVQVEKATASQTRNAEEMRLIEQAKQQSATQTLQAASDANAKSQARSQQRSSINQTISTGFAGAFAASCIGAGATCNWYFLAASVAFGILSSQNSKQAHNNALQGYEACRAQAQITGSQGTNCSVVEPTTTTGPDFASVSTNFNSDGTCRSTPTVCNEIISALPPGTNIKDVYKGASAFASTANRPFTINPDGSVKITKTGKTIPASSLNDPAAWAAAGFDPAVAKAAMSAASKASAKSGLAGASEELNAKNGANGAGGFNSLGGFSISGSGADGSGAGGSGKNGLGGTLGGKVIGGSGDKDGLGKDRKPAGQGLTKDFNGETIGAAGDDIFSMMNRRYQMKTAQDTFLNN